jgi:AraC-like DNA-binding protein
MALSDDQSVPDDVPIPRDLHGVVWRYLRGGQHHPLHHHADEVEFNLILAGHASYLINGHRYLAQAGDLLWMPAGVSHVLISPDGAYDSWVVIQRGGISPSVGIHGQGKGGASRRLPRRTAAALAGLCAIIAEHADDPASFNGGLRLLTAATWRAFAAAAANTAATVDPSVERAVRLLAENPTASLELAARTAGLSQRRMARLFRSQLGLAPAEVRSRIRLDRAIELHRSGRPLLAAAKEAGFGSYVQFYRIHVRVFGSSPRTGAR